MNKETIKNIIYIIVIVLAIYGGMSFIADTYTKYVHYYIKNHCELNIDINHSNNTNDPKDVYYICEVTK